MIQCSGDGLLTLLVEGMTSLEDHVITNDGNSPYRPAMLLGLCGTIFSITLFGFSQNFAWAVSARLLWGLLNGNIGVVKTYLSEVRTTYCVIMTPHYVTVTCRCVMIAIKPGGFH